MTISRPLPWILIASAVIAAGSAAAQLVDIPLPFLQSPSGAKADAPSAADPLLSDAGLHDLWLDISDADWQQLRTEFESNTYYRADLEWRGTRVTEIGVRSRGRATRNDRKPGLLLDINRFVDGQEFLGLKSLVLDNLWLEPSMVKERVSMALFRRIGLPAPRVAHTRLYVGSQRTYAGLYGIVENIDERFLTRVYGDDDGYLYEFERADDYRFEDLGDAFEPYARRFEPETRDDAPDEELFGPIRELVRVVNETPAAQLEQALAPHLDLEAFLTRLAVENYLAGWDGLVGDHGMANFYLYRPADSTRFETIAWDQDNTFTSLDFPPWYNIHGNVLTRKIWAEPRLRERYLRQLLRVADAAEGWLEEDARRASAQIREAALADTMKSQTDEEFAEATAFVARFARERPAGVRTFVAEVRAFPTPETLGR